MGETITEWLKSLIGGVTRAPVEGAKGALGTGWSAIRGILTFDTLIKAAVGGGLLTAVQFLLPQYWLSIGKSIMGEAWERDQRREMAKPGNEFEMIKKNMLLGLGGAATVNGIGGAAEGVGSSDNLAAAVGGLGLTAAGVVAAIGVLTHGGVSLPGAPNPTPVVPAAAQPPRRNQ